ncbi:Acyltransferase LovD [Colletotrichum trifolii]|uniref:Acyltransferase LovD n=1 Tax=Colletotrichum trifolii TaxID=5466 RepID=A0A4V3HW09_COLTR|nr:Acyltransferase LovD [Colletotrichum trifolii]
MATIDSILAKYTAAAGQDTKDKLLGASFVVVNKDGKFMSSLVYSGSAGRLGHASDARPWDVDTFTYTASMTKIITATSILQIVERGQIQLDDDVRGLVPRLGQMQILKGFDDDDEKPILEDHDTPITLRMLLTHTIGLGYDLADAELMRWHKAVGRTALNLDWSLDGFTTPLKFKPGQGWHYGTAVDWAGQVLEKITGRTIGEYMSEKVFGPLGMNDSGFWPERLPQTSDRTAEWAYRGEDKASLAPGAAPVKREHPIESGGAGLWTTARDYGKFLHALLTNRLVSQQTLDEMFRPQLDGQQAAMLNKLASEWGAIAVEFSPEMELNHGLGGCINMEDTPGKRKKGSMMWSGMCNSHWWMDRETGIAAALITQVLPHGDAVVTELYDELERAVYREPVA